MRSRLLVLILCLPLCGQDVMRVQRRTAAPPTIVATQICASTTSPCTVTATAAIDDLVIICSTSEGATIAAATSNPANTWTDVFGATIINAGAAMSARCYYAKLTAALTSGSSTVAWGTFGNTLLAYRIAGTTGTLDQTATNNAITSTTSYTSGTTPNTTGTTDACFALFYGGVTTPLTFATAGGETLLTSGSGLTNDGRTPGAEWKLVASGTAFQASATASTATTGLGGVACFK